MKSKKKNINSLPRAIKLLMTGIAMLSSGFMTQAQNGLDSVIVEKYYVANAADSAGSIGILRVGSVTYRLYADMQPGYKFQALYGVPGHELRFQTTTTFFNNEDRGAKVPDYISVTNTRKNTVMLDSWFSVGAAATGKMGVLKTEDTDGSIGNAIGLLLNADPTAGIQIMTQDGMLPGSPQDVTFVGLSTELAIFDATSQLGNLFTTTNGSVASLNGSTGPTSSNRVLVGQFTTNGKFSFKLNIQIGTPTGGVENYVAENPVGSEIVLPSLIYSATVPPTVSITAPAAGAIFTTGTVIPITANASDVDGTVDSVKFYVDGVLTGFDISNPYLINWTSTVGSHTLTAKAVDSDQKTTTSAPIVINITNNIFPSVVITSPVSTATFTPGQTVSVTVTASDADGTVDSVIFFVNGSKVGFDLTSPYQYNWLSIAGTKTLTATAIDDQGGKGTSAPVIISVIPPNITPSVSISSPLTGAIFKTGEIVQIMANAVDADGTISKVEFFINGAYAGTDTTFPHQFNWTAVAGNKTLQVVATDNSGAAKTSASISISVVNNVLPTCSLVTPTTGSTFTAGDIVPISANASDPDGIITSVQFFVDGILVNIDTLAPFQYNWTSYALTGPVIAVAIDNNGGQKISSSVSITVKNNVAPTVNISSPINNSIKLGPGPLVIQATAADADGYVDSVEFYVNAYKVGVAVSSPFQCIWMMTVAGKDTLTAIAIDNHGMQKTSANVVITVKDTTSGIQDINSLMSLFNLYPNPAKNYVVLEMSFDPIQVIGNEDNGYVLYDMKGKVLFQKNLGNVFVNYQELIDISSLPNGKYIIELSLGSNSSKKVFIINK